MAFGKCQNTKNPIFCSTPPKMKRNRPPPLPFIFGYFLLPPKFSAAQDGKNASRGSLTRDAILYYGIRKGPIGSSKVAYCFHTTNQCHYHCSGKRTAIVKYDASILIWQFSSQYDFRVVNCL